MAMKFINAKFFYERSELIDEDKYSYWWVLMGTLNTTSNSSLEKESSAIGDDAWADLLARTKHIILLIVLMLY